MEAVIFISFIAFLIWIGEKTGWNDKCPPNEESFPEDVSTDPAMSSSIGNIYHHDDD